MIAIAQPSDEQIRSEFTAMLPELDSRFRSRFRQNGRDLQHEYTAEGIAVAWQTYLAARRQGRTPTIGNLAWFSARSVLSGRRMAGYNSTDALSATRLARTRLARHTSLGDFQGDHLRGFYRVFGDRRWRWPVVDVVGPKIDWDEFIAGCDQRDQRIVEMKLEGCPQTEIAEELGVSCPAVSLRLRALRRRWDAQAVA